MLKLIQLAKPVLMTAVGTMAGQIVMLFALPLIAMGYAPEEVGEYNFLFSSGYLLACILCFKLELGILKEREQDALLAYRLCNRVVLTSLFVLFLLVLMFSQRSNSDFLYLMFLGAFWHLVAVGHYFTVKRQYLKLSILKIVPPLFFLIAIAISVSSELHMPIFDLQAVSWALGMLLFCVPVITKKDPEKKLISFEVYRLYYHKYKKLVLYQLPADFLSDISKFSMPLLIPLFYGNHAAGLYMIASKLLFFPLTLLNASLGVVYRREAISEYGKPDKFLKLFKEVFVLLLVLMTFYFVVGYYLIEPIMRFLFSDLWGEAVDVAIALVPFSAISIMYDTMSSVFFILNRQHYHLIVHGVGVFVVIMVVMLSGVFGFDFVKGLHVLSWSIFIVQLIGVSFSYRCVVRYCNASEISELGILSLKPEIDMKS